MARNSFSTLFGSPTQEAIESFQPFASDEDARKARDIEVAALKAFGFKVRKTTLRGQVRPYWAWGVPCGLSCTVYGFEVIESPAATKLAA